MSGSQRSLILARTQHGAESAARLVGTDAVSLVQPVLPDDESLVWAGGEVLVALDQADRVWLEQALSLARSVSGPGARVRLVLGPEVEVHELEGVVTDAFSGWLVDGVSVDGDVVSLALAPGTGEVVHGAVGEGVRGALRLSELLKVVRGPSRDVDAFGYRTSLMMSYLEQVPRLHAELDALGADLRAAQAKVRELEGERALRDAPAPPVRPGVDPGATTRRLDSGNARPRRRRRALVVLGLVAWLGCSAVASALLDLGVNGFALLVLLGVAFGGIYDGRRRAVRFNRVLRKVEREQLVLARAVQQLGRSTADGSQSLGRVVVGQAESTRRHGMELATQLASELASTGREVISEVDAAHAAAISRAVTNLEGTIDASASELVRLTDARELLRSELTTLHRQVEGQFRLRDVVEVTGSTPPLRGWAASPDVLNVLIAELRRLRPDLVVDLGSGASTVWLAMACRTMGLDAKVVALDHDPVFSAATSRLITECQVDDIAEVRFAPLEPTVVGGQELLWYATSALEDLEGIGLVFVDGPPGSSAPDARFPALPVLRDRLAPAATLVLDDAGRPEEAAVVRRWRQMFPEINVELLPLEKGAALFRVGGDHGDA